MVSGVSLAYEGVDWAVAMSSAQRELSLAFLGLISEGRKEEVEDPGVNGHDGGYVNDERAWCWHDQCEGLSRIISGIWS
jgi:hypothetical protein